MEPKVTEVAPPPPASTALTPAVKPEAALPAAPSPAEKLVLAKLPQDPYLGISQKAFPREQGQVLMAPILPTDVEIREDGIVFLPEIKYRRRLNEAFGPGGWALMPRTAITMVDNVLSREYALYVDGRFIAEARGENEYIEQNGNMTYPTAAEGLKSNALMRCCKDIGIASELWDPNFITNWRLQFALQAWCEKKDKHRHKTVWWRKDRQKPYCAGSIIAPAEAAALMEEGDQKPPPAQPPKPTVARPQPKAAPSPAPTPAPATPPVAAPKPAPVVAAPTEVPQPVAATPLEGKIETRGTLTFYEIKLLVDGKEVIGVTRKRDHYDLAADAKGMGKQLQILFGVKAKDGSNRIIIDAMDPLPEGGPERSPF